MHFVKVTNLLFSIVILTTVLLIAGCGEHTALTSVYLMKKGRTVFKQT